MDCGQNKQNKKSLANLLIPELILVYFALCAGGGTAFLSSIDPRSNILGFSLLIFAFSYLLCRNFCALSDRRFIICSTVLLIWIITHFFIDSHFQYLSYFFYTIFLVDAYLLACNFGMSLLYRFERIVFFLCIIAILFWLLELSIGYKMMAEIAPFRSINGNNGGSFLFYIVNCDPDQLSLSLGIPRNSGFGWEPGRFACFICLAFICRIIRTGGKAKLLSRTNLVYIITLLTTFSTTGYFTMLVIIALHLFSSRRMTASTKCVFISVFFMFVLGLLQLPFMTEKVIARINPDTFFANSSWLNSMDELHTVDRFEGLFLDALNLFNNPILGYGLADQDMYINNHISEYLVTSNGLVKNLAQLGLIVGIPVYYFISKFAISLPSLFGYKFKISFIIVLVLLSISYNFFCDPMVTSLLFVPSLYTKNHQN